MFLSEAQKFFGPSDVVRWCNVSYISLASTHLPRLHINWTKTDNFLERFSTFMLIFATACCTRAHII